MIARMSQDMLDNRAKVKVYVDFEDYRKTDVYIADKHMERVFDVLINEDEKVMVLKSGSLDHSVDTFDYENNELSHTWVLARLDHADGFRLSGTLLGRLVRVTP